MHTVSLGAAGIASLLVLALTLAAPITGATQASESDQQTSPTGSRRLPSAISCEARPQVPDGARPARPDAGVPSGSLHKETIRRVIRQHIPEVKICYESGMNRPPHPQGKVMTRFAIAGDGKVRSSCLVNSTMNQPNIELCILDAELRWEFPKPLGGGWVVVDYPYTLTPAPESQSPAPPQAAATPEASWEQISVLLEKVKAEPSLSVRTHDAEQVSDQVRRKTSGGAPPAKLVADLSALLNDQADSVRYWAAMALGHLGPRAASAVPALEKALKKIEGTYASKTSAPAIRFALEKIGGPAQ